MRLLLHHVADGKTARSGGRLAPAVEFGILIGAMPREFYSFLLAGALITLSIAWLAWPGHILKSQTRLQQRLSLLLAPGLATVLALVTMFRSLLPTLSPRAANPLTWIPIGLSSILALLVQSSVFGFVLWLASLPFVPLQPLFR